MPTKSVLMYNDCREKLDEALAHGDKGLDVDCGTYAKAVVFRSRCNRFRVLDRETNKLIYDSEKDLMWGRSAYDNLILSIPKDRKNLVVIRPRVDLGPYPSAPGGTWFPVDGIRQPSEPIVSPKLIDYNTDEVPDSVVPPKPDGDSNGQD